MDEVHAPSLVRFRRLEDLVDAFEAMALAFASTHLQPGVSIDPIRALQVDLMAFAANQDVQATVAPSLSFESLLLDQLQQLGIVPAGLVAVAASGHADQPAG